MRSFFIVIFAVTFLACIEDVNKNLMKGEWLGVSWSVAEGDDYTERNHEGFSFVFNDDGTYSAIFGNSVESGTYWVEREKLYTTAQGKTQKVVKILTINDTMMTIQMNRGGSLELIELKRK